MASPNTPAYPADTGAPAAPVGGSASPSVLSTAAYPGWEAIYADNVARIYRLMFTKVGNRVDAEDLTSQVFLNALAPLRTSAIVGEVRAYLLHTARTVLATHWRSTMGHPITTIDFDELDLLAPAAPANTDIGGHAPPRITAILAELPERHRRILTLRFLRGYSIKQVAAELEVSVANAKVLQHRALRQAAGLDPEQGTAA
ncbi:MAG: RNA polymerase subunit sigma [Pseudonocardiales bacterium]|nr:MAG: RNA polymerase subunit sigma [Pseudonocardiales bacterium]